MNTRWLRIYWAIWAVAVLGGVLLAALRVRGFYLLPSAVAMLVPQLLLIWMWRFTIRVFHPDILPRLRRAALTLILFTMVAGIALMQYLAIRKWAHSLAGQDPAPPATRSHAAR